MMNCQEFATLHKYGIAVKTVVLRNNTLGMVHQWQGMFYKGHFAESDLTANPSIAGVARSMGVPAWTVEKKKICRQPWTDSLHRKDRRSWK